MGRDWPARPGTDQSGRLDAGDERGALKALTCQRRKKSGGFVVDAASDAVVCFTEVSCRGPGSAPCRLELSLLPLRRTVVSVVWLTPLLDISCVGPYSPLLSAGYTSSS
ncbi:hypothetical protein ACOMHN_031872 [Nucella lapillus]